MELIDEVYEALICAKERGDFSKFNELRNRNDLTIESRLIDNEHVNKRYMFYVTDLNGNMVIVRDWISYVHIGQTLSNGYIREARIYR